jgi:transcriptional regulator with XRE-family HTH domain
VSSLADRLHRARLNSGNTIEKVSDLSGVASGDLSLIEAGQTEPEGVDLERLGQVYGCSVEFLKEG